MQEARPSVLWTWSNIAVIAICATGVLFPGVQRSIFFIIPMMVLFAAHFTLMIRREHASGVGNVPISEIPQRVRRGLRLPRSALEWATAAAMALFVIRLMN